MNNIQDFIAESGMFKTFKVDELLFAEFKCPVEASSDNIWCENNFFAFILTGETTIKTPITNGENARVFPIRSEAWRSISAPFTKRTSATMKIAIQISIMHLSITKNKNLGPYWLLYVEKL